MEIEKIEVQERVLMGWPIYLLTIEDNEGNIYYKMCENLEYADYLTKLLDALDSINHLDLNKIQNDTDTGIARIFNFNS